MRVKARFEPEHSTHSYSAINHVSGGTRESRGWSSVNYKTPFKPSSPARAGQTRGDRGQGGVEHRVPRGGPHPGGRLHIHLLRTGGGLL